MAILICNDMSRFEVCSGCGDGWDETNLVCCDDCGKTLCFSCEAELHDPDCPNDFCVECASK